jgi:hypothetical protein
MLLLLQGRGKQLFLLALSTIVNLAIGLCPVSAVLLRFVAWG